MADTEQLEVPEGEAPEAEEAPAGGRRRLPLIALAAVGLAVGAGTGAMVIGPMLAKKMGKAPAAAHADSTDAAAEGENAEGGHDGKSDGKSAATPSVHLLENLVLNPAGSGGSRFLLLSLAIECADGKALTAMQARDAELRDIILTSLGNKTVDELTDVSGRDRIKAEILASIGERFGKKSVSRIYFPQFVVQ